MTKKYHIVCFDLDGTIIRNTTANLHFAELLGVREQVLDLENKFHCYEIDSTEFMEQIKHFMGNLSVNYIAQHFKTLPIINGLDKTLKTLKEHGLTTALVTSSIHLFAKAFKRRYDFDYAYGTKYTVRTDGKLQKLKTCSGELKVTKVKRIADTHNVGLEKVVAIGDSLTDIQLFSQVGKAIAINHDHHLEGKAHIYLKTDDIYEVIEHIL